MRIELKSKRQKKGLTQVQTAKKLDVSERYYQQIEAGTRNGDVSLWINICKAFDLTLITELEDLFEIPQRQLRETSPSEITHQNDSMKK